MDDYFEQHKPTYSIAHYLSVGSKARDVKTLGFELEHFVVRKGSLAPVPYRVENGSSEPSVQHILEHLNDYYPEATYEDSGNGSPYLFGLNREKVAVSLEPGAQLEVSIGPAVSVKEIDTHYQQFRSEVDPILDSMGLQLLARGYHPTALARDIQLLPKHRYEYMDDYFTHTGKHGICMMRATASTQVSIDFASEADALAKFRIANALGPFFAFLTDNSPVFEAERIGALGGTVEQAASGLAVPWSMARMVCWDDTDPERSLIAKGGFDEDFSFLRYAADLMEAPAIFLPGPDASSKPVYLGFTSFEQALPNDFIDEAMVLHILSLFFFDARFKNYLEIRQADSLPREYAMAYAALISGIFYNPEALRYYADCFASTDSTAIALAKSALREHGYAAEVYGRPATDWLDGLLEHALGGLSAEDAPYLTPLLELVAKRASLLELLP